MTFIKNVKIALMEKYCPEFYGKMPNTSSASYRCSVLIIHGYFGHKCTEVASKTIKGSDEAYLWVRRRALVEQVKRPSWLFDCGIRWEMIRLES